MIATRSKSALVNTEVKMKRTTIVAAVAIALLSLGAVAATWLGATRGVTRQEGGKSFGYAVKQAPGYFSEGVGSKPKLYWVDDQRVLFLGLSEEDHKRTPRENPTYAIRLWNTATGTVEELGQARGELCLFQGHLSYLVFFDSVQSIWRKGTLTETVEIVRPKQEDAFNLRVARGEREHPFNCERYNVRTLGEEGECRTPLVDDDGLIDASGRRCSEDARSGHLAILYSAKAAQEKYALNRDLEYQIANRPVLYFRSPDAAPVELAIKSRELYPIGESLTYAPWSRAYTMIAKASRAEYWRGNWPRGAPFVVYTVYPGGKLDTFEIPWSDEIRRIPLKAALTKKGLVLVNKDRTTQQERGPSGLYLLSDDALRHVYAGDVTELAVSPNGCKAAFDVRVEMKHSDHPFVKYVRTLDLCEER